MRLDLLLLALALTACGGTSDGDTTDDSDAVDTEDTDDTTAGGDTDDEETPTEVSLWGTWANGELEAETSGGCPGPASVGLTATFAEGTGDTFTVAFEGAPAPLACGPYTAPDTGEDFGFDWLCAVWTRSDQLDRETFLSIGFGVGGNTRTTAGLPVMVQAAYACGGPACSAAGFSGGQSCNMVYEGVLQPVPEDTDTVEGIEAGAR